MEKISENQSKVQRYYNRGARERPDFRIADRVYFQNQSNIWCPGKIVDVCDSPRSYMVKGEDDAVYRRNKSMIRIDKRYEKCRDHRSHSSVMDPNLVCTTRSGLIRI